MSEQKKSILKHILTYASSQYFSQFIGFFTAVFMRRFLGPFNMGIWSILKVVADYATYTHLGTTSTVFYKVPLLRGKGETEEADNVKNVVFSYLTLTCFIGGIAIALYAFLFREKLSPQIFWGLLVVSVFLLIQRIYTYYIMLLRAHKDFTVLSKSIVFNAVVNLGLIFLLVKNFGLKGLFVSVVLMPVLNILFIRHFVTYDIRYRLNFKKLGSYIKFGFPLFITSILAMVLWSVDKIMIARFLGLEALGFYSIAVMTRSYGVGLSRNFNVVITPHFLEDYGRTRDLKTASKYLKTPAELMSSFMALILGLIYIAAPTFILYVLPKFTPGIMPMKLFLLATFFYTASPQSEHFLIAMNKQTRLVPIASFVIILNIMLNFLFIKLGFGITGVAGATAIAAFAAFTITLLYALLHIEDLFRSLKFILVIVFPLIYSVSILFMLDRLIIFENPLMEAIMRSVLFIALFSPWLIKVNRSTVIFSTLKKMITGKFKREEVEAA